MKIIGRKKVLTPEENLLKLEALIREAEKLRPVMPKEKGIFKFKTWDELYNFTITRASRRK